MIRKTHPNKHIEAAVTQAEAKGWVVKPAKGHAWGIMRCPWNDEDCRCGEFCLTSIWSTPRSPENHAKQLKRVVEKCIHVEAGPLAQDAERTEA